MTASASTLSQWIISHDGAKRQPTDLGSLMKRSSVTGTVCWSLCLEDAALPVGEQDVEAAALIHKAERHDFFDNCTDQDYWSSSRDLIARANCRRAAAVAVQCSACDKKTGRPGTPDSELTTNTAGGDLEEASRDSQKAWRTA